MWAWLSHHNGWFSLCSFFSLGRSYKLLLRSPHPPLQTCTVDVIVQLSLSPHAPHSHVLSPPFGLGTSLIILTAITVQVLLLSHAYGGYAVLSCLGSLLHSQIHPVHSCQISSTLPLVPVSFSQCLASAISLWSPSLQILSMGITSALSFKLQFTFPACFSCSHLPTLHTSSMWCFLSILCPSLSLFPSCSSLCIFKVLTGHLILLSCPPTWSHSNCPSGQGDLLILSLYLSVSTLWYKSSCTCLSIWWN